LDTYSITLFPDSENITVQVIDFLMF